MRQTRTIFVTGTDTDVGKTFVSAVLHVGLKAHYWKPIQCGTEPCSDTEWICNLGQLDKKLYHPETFKLGAPVSPHLAARMENKSIHLEQFELPKVNSDEWLIVEGAGGVMVPVNETQFVIDLIKHLQTPVILVTRSALGTINHTLLSLAKLREAQIPVVGVVMNGPRSASNKEAIEHYGKTAVIAEIEPCKNITKEALERIFHECFAPEIIEYMASVHPNENGALAIAGSQR